MLFLTISIVPVSNTFYSVSVNDEKLNGWNARSIQNNNVRLFKYLIYAKNMHAGIDNILII
jgi:hypothetical protein